MQSGEEEEETDGSFRYVRVIELGCMMRRFDPWKMQARSSPGRLLEIFGSEASQVKNEAPGIG